MRRLRRALAAYRDVRRTPSAPSWGAMKRLAQAGVAAAWLFCWGAGDARSASDDRAMACREAEGSTGEPYQVRGRLYAANGGGSGYRIWIVGTKRIVYVSPRVEPVLPVGLEKGFTAFSEVVYGDFTLQGLAPDRPGVMREVCVVAVARHLVAPASGRPHR
jgi:hypothetical protein